MSNETVYPTIYMLNFVTCKKEELINLPPLIKRSYWSL